MEQKKELVIFETKDHAVKLEVPVNEETVWLTQAQMASLFQTTKQNISLHVNNCFREKELDKNSVVKDFLTTASDGKQYKTKFYNLDVIISVGYRVKSKRGVEFRKWANSVLKQYILQGHDDHCDHELPAVKRYGSPHAAACSGTRTCFIYNVLALRLAALAR